MVEQSFRSAWRSCFDRFRFKKSIKQHAVLQAPFPFLRLRLASDTHIQGRRNPKDYRCPSVLKKKKKKTIQEKRNSYQLSHPEGLIPVSFSQCSVVRHAGSHGFEWAEVFVDFKEHLVKCRCMFKLALSDFSSNFLIAHTYQKSTGSIICFDFCFQFDKSIIFYSAFALLFLAQCKHFFCLHLCSSKSWI